MNTVYLSIGSNMDKEVNFPACFHRLHKHFQVMNISSVYATVPVGPVGQEEFWNAAVEIRTSSSIEELKHMLNEIESDFGRERDPTNKYAPRPIDIDMILYNDLVVQSETIVLPSPQLEKFAFVLIPTAEIAPDVIHPELGHSLAYLADHFEDHAQQWNRLPNNYAMRKKVALITGGAARVGEALCRHYAKHGYAVAIHYHTSDKQALLLRDEIQSDGGTAMCIRENLRDPEAPHNIIQKVIDQWGFIDVVINNASVFYPTPTSELVVNSWDEIMAVNLRAPHFVVKFAAPHLAKQRGAIVHIADIYAERPLPTHSVYCMAKAGLVTLTKVLANELAPRIRVNAIEPGAILFPEQYTEEQKAALLKNVPLAQPGTVNHIAETAFFLTDGPSYITGTVIPVDGGRLTMP